MSLLSSQSVRTAPSTGPHSKKPVRISVSSGPGHTGLQSAPSPGKWTKWSSVTWIDLCVTEMSNKGAFFFIKRGHCGTKWKIYINILEMVNLSEAVVYGLIYIRIFTFWLASLTYSVVLQASREVSEIFVSLKKLTGLSLTGNDPQCLFTIPPYCRNILFFHRSYDHNCRPHV